MADYGGLGGLKDLREINKEDAFEAAVNRALGDHIRTDDEVCRRMWSALANQGWHHDNGDTAAYSFRAAGDLIAAIRGQGNYMDWYCSGPYESVSEKIKDAMAKEGWHPDD